MNKTHALKEVPQWDYETAFTHCGLEGVKDKFVATEYQTVLGNRWEIAGRGYKPTCRRCLMAHLEGVKS